MSDTQARDVAVEFSRGAAMFLAGAVGHMNQRKLLPENDAQALQTSAWLEEIEAKLVAALEDRGTNIPKFTEAEWRALSSAVALAEAEWEDHAEQRREMAALDRAHKKARRLAPRRYC